MDATDQAIAIVGLGAILPDAPNVAAFWQNLLNKRYSISDVPPERWRPDFYYDPDPRAPDKTYTKIGGWVRGFQFDWKRFRLPPRVAEAMDEVQQWAVTVAADALADYGYPDRPLDTERTAVILGTAMGGELHYLTHMRVVFPEFADALAEAESFQQLPPAVRQAILAQWHERLNAALPPITEDSMPGELPNVVSGRVANILNLRGPNFITDAACASSLAAMQAAMEMLVEHQVDAVVTGGVDRNMGVSSFVKFCKIGALSATGTRPFGDGADGFVMGEGAAAFLLKRLADAERDGDRIYAVIRGIGGASDGKGKGITAPNPIGQQLAMQRAWEAAGLEPGTANLIEAHGTSTRVGDVVEVESLNTVFGCAPRGSIGLGSAKSNIGHLKAGAGAAGLLKATLALHHKILPPTLNAEKPNPQINFEQTPFYLLHEPRTWEKTNGTPRRCGVSAYGFGGTNFHVVMEEHVPGALTAQKQLFTTAQEPAVPPLPAIPAPPAAPAPPRGILALGATTMPELQQKLAHTLERLEQGWTPPVALPEPADVTAPERLVVDFGNREELLDRLRKAQKVMALDSPAAWKAMQPQGIFRGSGKPNGKLAFLFPGQGSQYVNMGRELVAFSPAVAAVFAEADQIMTPLLGKPLTSYLFANENDAGAVNLAALSLMQTEVTQPAMLTLDMAIYRLLGEYGFRPDMVMGHSLGEYAALIAAGIMPFAHALEAAAARGQEMSKVSVDDNGKMAAVLAPFEVVETVLAEVDGYVVPANINSPSQAVIGGASAAVEQAVALFTEKGYRAMMLPVSHAFHTSIVAPASEPLRQVLNRLSISPPQLPLVGNVTGDFYPQDVEGIKDLLQQQIASPVQWVRGLQTLDAAGVRTFVEVGPKRALHGFVSDLFKEREDVTALLTNHPKYGELVTFNQALCGLYAAGFGRPAVEAVTPAVPVVTGEKVMDVKTNGAPVNAAPVNAAPTSGTPPVEVYREPQPTAYENDVYDRNRPPRGSVVISGTGLGLPGAEKPVMDPDNALRILRGEQFVDLIPARFRQRMVGKRIVRLVKAEDGSGSLVTIDDTDDVIKLAGRPGAFDLHEEYGVPTQLIEALDITSQLAMAAGLDALREAGIPLVQTYKRTTTGKYLPQDWRLPESLRDETGVIFASAFPGGDRFADEFSRYYIYQNLVDQVDALEDLRRYTTDENTLLEIGRRLSDLREQLEAATYNFDRRFLFRILCMGHSQFAQYIGARGPNAHVNAACASTTQAIALGEDWIRSGRCRRVIVIAADDVTGDHLMEWVGAGFLAVGAATTQDRVEEAALPFDVRRHGTIMGMGSCALVLESEDAVRERGMRGIVELLSSETNNSAYHGTRLDVAHISQILENLVSAAERRFALNRQQMAGQLVFMSHETFTPARGGSAAAEVAALRQVFGPAANDIVVANTKGFTGHPMGVGIEDAIAVKILEYGIVPPVPNFKEVDPDLGVLNLSRGGRYPVQYAIHLAAGFGSQIAFTLTRRIPGNLDRVDHKPLYQQWLADISGYHTAETEVEKRVLRIQAQGNPPRTPVASRWQPGTEPMFRAPAGNGSPASYAPRPMVMPQPAVPEKKQNGHAVTPRPEPIPAPVAPAPEPVVLAAEPMPAPAAPAPAVPTPEPPAPSGDPIAARVLAIVAAQTGYPEEMLEMDLDLEADLGIDTVKQAETFAAIRAEFDIPRRDDLKLSEYTTLQKVLGFVREMRPDLEAAEVPAAAPAPQAPQAAPAAPVVVEAPAGDPVAARVLAIVAAQTGYPEEMLEMDLDLEADLGIDTVKQAETFAAIRAEFDIPRRDDLKLSEYTTLQKVVGFVREMRPDLEMAKPPTAPIPAAPIVATEAPTGDPVAARVLAIVAAQTGYPEEMLEMDLDLEADLGIDTVKQAETFAAIRAEFDIPRRDDLKLSEYTTLQKVVGFVHEMRPKVGTNGVQPVNGHALPTPPAAAPPAVITIPAPEVYPLENANELPRRVPVPMLRPGLDLCKPTGVTLDSQSRVVVMADEGGVAKALMTRLEKLGVAVLALEHAPAADQLEAQLQQWLAAGPIQGVYWLAALDAEPPLEEMELETWREMNGMRVKNLAVTMRTLYESINPAGTFLITATRLGGLHGYGPQPAIAPLGGAVSGFTKAYKRERPNALVKVVDFAPGCKTAGPADALLAETLSDPGVVEVGYWQDERYAITLMEEAIELDPVGAQMELNQESVFLVTGAAGGITSAIVADLAAASGGTFYLLDRVAAPDLTDEKIALFRQDREALKQHLIAQAKAAGERPTPVLIEQQMLAVEREEAALRAIESVQAAGGTAHYRSVDLLDDPAIAAVVEEVRAQSGRIDVLIHAGGIEISRALADKAQTQFDLVFDIKADGFFSLLRAAQHMPIGVTLAFSSVAGRFGNNGQTDYSAANDLLCKISSSLQRNRPETRAIVIDWTAWGEIGMATRGSIPKIMEMAGIDMLPPHMGIPTVRRELLYGNGEVVVGGRLGMLTQEWDESGGLDVDKVNAWLAAQERPSPLLGQVRAAKLYGGLEVVTTLDPQQQPFLRDHALEGTPLLPGVMGTEAFAQLASALAPTFQVAAVENVRFESPFKFYRMEPQTLYLEATLRPVNESEVVAITRLRSVREPHKPGLPVQEKTHFTAEVRLTRQPLEQPQVPFTPPATQALSIPAASIYNIFFHGPAYQVLEGVQVAGEEAIGLLAANLPPNMEPAGSRELIAPRLVELCFQTAGVWDIHTHGKMALPLAIGAVTTYRPEAEGSGRRLYALVKARQDGAGFDAQVVDEAGNLYLTLYGYRTVDLPGRVEL